MGVKNQRRRDFICSPVVTTSPSNDGVWVQSLVKVLRPMCLLAKNQTIKQKQFFYFIVTNSIKTLKMVHIKKKNLKKKKRSQGRKPGPDLEKDLELSRAETGTRSW